MFYRSLIETADRMTLDALNPLPTAEAWLADLPQRRASWLDMLGLLDRPRGELAVEHTGELQREGYVVEKLHYQPLENCRIAANLYRPADIAPGERLPTVLYVCGHAAEAKAYRNYQGHGRWFARHGYVCMVVDTIWAGESVGLHHGVYDRHRYDWISRGYSPAAVEVWSAMRALDYLQGRSEVDAERLGMTGNSGGGGMTWFTAAADERVKVAAPSCQTASTRCFIRHRLQDGHCDCTFWINTAGWSFAQMASLIAPRPLMIASQSRDSLFRPWGYREVYLKLRQVYERLGREDLIALQEDHHEHGYTAPQRKAIFNFFEKHLKGVDAPQAEDWDDYVEPAENLQVFTGGKVPDCDRMKDVGDFFMPTPPEPRATEDARAFEAWRAERLGELRRRTFSRIPDPVAAPTAVHEEYQGHDHGMDTHWLSFESEPHVAVKIVLVEPVGGGAKRLTVAPLAASEDHGLSPYRWKAADGAYAIVHARGTGDTAIGGNLLWSVRRGYMLMGLSLTERQIFDVLTALAVLRRRRSFSEITLLGRGVNASAATYAAILDPAVDALRLDRPVLSDLRPEGPELPAIARIGQLANNLALMHPRPIGFAESLPPEADFLHRQYQALGNGAKVYAYDAAT